MRAERTRLKMGEKGDVACVVGALIGAAASWEQQRSPPEQLFEGFPDAVAA